MKEKIPKGPYCYDENNHTCPYWCLSILHDEQNNGYCHFLKRGDWERYPFSLLWDQVKECNNNNDFDLLNECGEYN